MAQQGMQLRGHDIAGQIRRKSVCEAAAFDEEVSFSAHIRQHGRQQGRHADGDEDAHQQYGAHGRREDGRWLGSHRLQPAGQRAAPAERGQQI